jgi:hypothetical protein
MGWRERDWAKFTPEEFDAIYGGGASPPLRSSSSRTRVGSGGRILGGSAAGVVVIFAALLLTGHLKTPGADPAVKPGLQLNLNPLAPVKVPAPPQDPSLIRIRWRAADLAPAPYAGSICVTDPRHGRICSSYVAGERPADTLARRLLELGLEVESSG